jgi:hypothetical protein
MQIEEALKLDPLSEEFWREILEREKLTHECLGQLYRSILYGEADRLRVLRYKARTGTRPLPGESLPPALPCNSYDIDS